MDGAGGTARRDSREPRAGGRVRRQDRSVAVARPRPAPHDRRPTRGRLMHSITPPRASRFQDRGQRVRVSFEFFPPKTAEMEKTLWEAIARLAPLAPSFVSVTYGAGGSTRERTHATVKRIIAETPLAPAAHLTCVAADRAEVDGVIRSYVAAGGGPLGGLRGGPVSGVGERYAPHPE